MTTRTSPKKASRAASLMRAVAIDRFGGPEELTVHTLPVPQPGTGQVLIALHWAGVGSWDKGTRSGEWAEGNEKFPLVIGMDGAGAIAAVGARVTDFRIGDRVWAYDYSHPKGGFYSEFVVVDAKNVAHVPMELDLASAGAGAATGLTALQGIDDHIDVKRDETVLIVGASGAVGSLAVQFAKRRGARVIGTATGAEAMTLVRNLGADGVFDARDRDAVARLRALAPSGVDAALVFAGGADTERCLDLVVPGGRIAYPNGVEPEPKRRAKIKVTAYDAAVGKKEFAALGRAAVEAKLRVPTADTFPLERAAAAHERLEKGQVLGRMLLQIR